MTVLGHMTDCEGFLERCGELHSENKPTRDQWCLIVVALLGGDVREAGLVWRRKANW